MSKIRRYGYGTPLLVSGFGGQLKLVTALRAVEDNGQPAGEGVDQQGNRCWWYDNQIIKVLE